MLRRVGIGLLALGVACSRRSVPIPDKDASAIAMPTPPTVVATPIQEVQGARSLDEAFVFARAHMTDPHGRDGDGTILLTAWAARSMTWSDVNVATNETSHALVMKDADEERGKRLCVSGHVVQIEVAKPSWGKYFEGLLMSWDGSLFRFLCVRSSGAIVQRSNARLCGVVTGRYDYSNSGGGEGHATKLVGIFDLPENKRDVPVAAPQPPIAAPRASPVSDRPAPIPVVSVAPAPSAEPPRNCNPPYVFDDHGVKHYKTECM